MRRHPHWDLWLHDDSELGGLLGSAVLERVTIHEWPLSSVQRVRTADGRRHIYKVQAPPSVEPEFYARARSPLLVPARILPSRGTTAALCLPEIDAPRLSEARPSPAQAPAVAFGLVRQIAAIEGDLPALADVSTVDGWATHFGAALVDMRACVAEGSFRQVGPALIDRLAALAEAPEVLTAVRSPSGYVHSDLMADNVLATPAGLRVLDWQRPIRGPVALDVATLLISLDLNPLPHVPPGIVTLYHLLHVAWYAQGARRWLPGGRAHLDGIIARIGARL